MSDLPHTIAQLRKSYGRAELNEASTPTNPLELFAQWLQEAINAQLPEPNAMTLATVSSAMRPSTRVVLIKGFDARGIVWYTNYQSRKAKSWRRPPLPRCNFIGLS